MDNTKSIVGGDIIAGYKTALSVATVSLQRAAIIAPRINGLSGDYGALYSYSPESTDAGCGEFNYDAENSEYCDIAARGLGNLQTALSDYISSLCKEISYIETFPLRLLRGYTAQLLAMAEALDFATINAVTAFKYTAGRIIKGLRGDIRSTYGGNGYNEEFGGDN